MKTLNLNKKQKIWIITGSVMAAIIIALSVFMIVCVSASVRDGTVPSGTTSLIGNFLRNKNKIDYAVFDDEAEFPVDDFRVSLSVMNHWEDGTADKTIAHCGDTVSITAGEAAEGKVFDKWTCETDGITIEFASATSASTTFTMPAGDVAVKAN